jgi:hypothetical protein
LDKEYWQKLLKRKFDKYGTGYTEPQEQTKSFWDKKKWFLRDDCKKKEIRKKVSPVFYEVIAYLHINKRSYKESIKLTQQLNLELYEGEKIHLLSTLDMDYLAQKNRVTKDNVRKQIARCCSKYGPFKKLKMTNAKRFGGTTLYAIGYWEPTPENPRYECRAVKFFKQTKSIEKWRRNVLYRKK